MVNEWFGLGMFGMENRGTPFIRGSQNGIRLSIRMNFMLTLHECLKHMGESLVYLREFQSGET